MKKDELKNARITDAGLDAALAQMADEVPPMPADFHDRWMNAVCAEAEKAAPAADNDSRNKIVSITCWTRILSVAAVFMFLIGGTLLYRNARKSQSVPYAVKEQETTGTAAEEPAAVFEEAGEEEEADVAEPVMMNASVQDAAKGSKAAGTEKTGGVLSANDSGAVPDASWEEPAVAAGAAVTAEAEYDGAFEAEEAAEEPAATSAPTAAPTKTPEPASEPAEEPGKESGFLPAAGAFFTDMGDFLLAALPYLLVLAVPAVAALVIRRKEAGK